MPKRRVGSIDQPTSFYLTGNFENFNDGGWNGDLPGFFAGATQVTWPFSDVGSYYTTSKVVYLSLQIFGFDLGASYEPSTNNPLATGGQAPYVSAARNNGASFLVLDTAPNANRCRRSSTSRVKREFRSRQTVA